MSATVILQLAGPMQAWGVQSRFEIRETMTEPSKSGVVGLIASALGRDRQADISDLAALRMGVRVDREGEVRRDFHTVKRSQRDRRSNSYSAPQGMATLSTRYYLADAMFVVGLESDDRSLLKRIDEALDRPHWPLFLGRKAFPPSRPIRTPYGVMEQSIEAALQSIPWIGTRPDMSIDDDRRPAQLRVLLEASASTEQGLVRLRRPDQPISFEDRRFEIRDIVVTHYPLAALPEEQYVSE